MAHSVKCKYCGEKFDRDTIAYVQPSAKRYAHATCYLRGRAEGSITEELEVIDPNDFVECFVCKKIINKKTDTFKMINGKYAHAECAELEEKREKTDAEQLDLFIMQLFNTDYVSPRIRGQINKFQKDYNYTYSGIQKALQYFYVIKGNSLEKANGGIGIVPYIYKDAYNYYYALWEASQKNEHVVVKEYVPVVKEIVIQEPQREVKKRKAFTFLDTEE